MKRKNLTLQLLQMIREHGIPVGASLLCTDMDLPQATVGRMLFSLEKQGYLQKISNKGRILTPEGIQYLDQQEQLAEKFSTAKKIIEAVKEPAKEDLYEILDVRIALESLAAVHACRNRTEQDLEDLEGILRRHYYDLQRGGIGSDQDLEFHLKIAEMSGNQTLVQLLRLILTRENAHTRFSQVAPHVSDTQVRQHRAIMDAIRSGNEEEARIAVSEHLHQVAEDVRNYYKRSVL